MSGRGWPGGTFHFYYSFAMKLHPRVLGADRGNFTAAVGGCERAEITPPKWDTDEDAAQAGTVLVETSG